MATSREGFQWTPASGLQAGLPCLGVIEPPQNVDRPDQVFDVAIIGAGYTGLTAARDVTVSGLKTLLVEGRDRIGGRTWSSNIDGYPYEMGGTWVHWFQPHVYRELSRYGMRDELVHCPDFSQGVNHFSFVTEHGRRNMSHEEEQELCARAIGKLADVDGNRGKTVVPFPFNAHWNKDILKFSDMSIADRIEQIKDNLDEDERHAISALVLVCSGGTLENSAFLDFLRWWAAGNYDFETFFDTIIVFKLRSGQSTFARRFFDEAKSTGNLSYSFNTKVDSIDSTAEDVVRLQSSDGRHFRARRLICTVPLNVLNKVRFNPPLNPAKTEAATLKHVNQVVKVHAEVQGTEMRSWSGMSYPNNKLLLGSADGTTPAGNTHCVFFGGHENHMHVDENVDEALNAINELEKMQIERLVFHNWSKDEFAQGAWVWYRPGMEVKYLEALRQRQGSILFANSDWAAGGWRSFIDGAIQSGTEAALTVVSELAIKEKSTIS